MAYFAGIAIAFQADSILFFTIGVGGFTALGILKAFALYKKQTIPIIFDFS
jgi:hypothetical protein